MTEARGLKPGRRRVLPPDVEAEVRSDIKARRRLTNKHLIHRYGCSTGIINRIVRELNAGDAP